MMRLAGAGDLAELRGFLERHVETSMFLLGNLEAHGLEGSSHPHATRYFLWCDPDGALEGVFGATRSGFLMCQMPAITDAASRAFVAELQGTGVLGITGAEAQVEAVLKALPIPVAAWQYNDTQPLYGMACADLPDLTPEIRHASEADRPLLERWFTALEMDTGLASEEAAARDGKDRAGAAIGSDRFVFLLENGQPVAMSSINAKAGDAVQVGGVYVPPELRGKGRGGRVVAHHLTAARSRGTRRAILFAASPSAARVYERIGFERVGDYRVAVLNDAVTIGAAA